MFHSPVRRPTRSLGLLLSVLAVSALLAQQPAPPAAPAPSAQPPAQPPPPPPQRFRTEANYVRVDVYPTKDGLAVQDLTAEDFELLEDGARQKVDAFEHVVISPAGPQTIRAEANSVRGGEQMAGNPRNRVFVFFLDIPHVSVEGSHAIKEPLIRLIDRILGPDDLIAVMTPEMSAAQITFGRKTEVIADMLRDKWTWGVRHSIIPMDAARARVRALLSADEQRGPGRPGRRQDDPAPPRAHRARRPQRSGDVPRHGAGGAQGHPGGDRGLAVVPAGFLDDGIAEGAHDRRLRTRTGKPPIGVDEQGKLRVNPPQRDGGIRRRSDGVRSGADVSRQHRQRRVLPAAARRANRYNSSFYPIDPRGLAIFDYPIGPARPPSLTVDLAHLRTRITTLQTLAENTDGIAVVNSNDLDKGLRRIADDLSSYYLLGYYSSNPKLDGGYRKIAVRVKRPGVQVRARRATARRMPRRWPLRAPPRPRRSPSTSKRQARRSAH